MVPKTCSIPECDSRHLARGWCSKHYNRWQKHGDPLATLRIVGDDTARFNACVSKSAECWEWTAPVDKDGYGKFYRGGHMYLAHRLAYEWAVGPIPEGMQIDHRCHNAGCVNPGHLRVVTHKQNMENKTGAQRGNISGARGVHWNKASKNWRVMVGHNGKSIYVGTFLTIEAAEAAAIAKRIELFTHNDIDRIAA